MVSAGNLFLLFTFYEGPYKMNVMGSRGIDLGDTAYA